MFKRSTGHVPRVASVAAGRCVGEYRIIYLELTPMPTEKASSFATIATGTAVTWHYRSAIGHGTVTGIHKRGTTADNTMYSIRQHDHHPGEPAVVYHYGKALTRVAK